MNTVIMKKDHDKKLWNLRKRHWLVHFIGVLITISILAIPYGFKLDRDLMTEAYRVARGEFDSLTMRHKLLTVLRAKPLTVGQALDIADVVMEQRAIPPSIILAIMDVESEFKAGAISEKGARGLMQSMPLNTKTYVQPTLTKSIHDPVINMRAGLGYLEDLKKSYGDWPRVLRVYNGGPNNAGNRELDGYVKAVMVKASKYGKKLEE